MRSGVLGIVAFVYVYQLIWPNRYPIEPEEDHK